MPTASPGDASGDSFDYVIVGAGAAGCLLAHRLSEDGRHTVCLLEAGPPDRSPFIHIPAGFIKVGYDPRYTWSFSTEPGEGTAGRRITTQLGRTLGGSSSINGFNYTRGVPADYDGWAARGNPGWAYADVLPYFKRTERRIGAADPRWRGTDGLLPITDCDWRHPLCDGFIDGADALGIPRDTDYNASDQAGAGYYQRWIQHGRRVSAAKAFLAPAMRRPNLQVRTGAHATAVRFDGRRATGVRFRAAPGAPERTVSARREVILCAGAANTPKLLQLSGVGAPALLQSLGIAPVHALPGVGEGLQDHFMVRSIVRVQGVQTINGTARGWRLLAEIGKWMARRPSVLAISPSVAYAFAKSRPDAPAVDLQFHFSPGSYASGIAGRLDDFPGMTLGFYQLRPESAGFVRATSADPFAPPAIQPHYLAAEGDRRTVVDGLRLARRLLHTPALQRYIAADEAPPASATSDEALLDYARQRGGTAWHFMGTCRMGPADDPMAVVDAELRVHGLEGLRIADASVMPAMPSGNTGAPTMMVAEKAADLVQGRVAPPREFPQV
ncbi:FAD-dependent oxidoreductase [uncultured Xylophilus sp.]|uniref:GMC family oxidoreductase n=1 Tax=uncultured Xylophilus sp. TaxID=296832 RepID=UPI0026006677|nr:FAD-dependent oxidoreductase [uncultured Xylophilus sp.]